MSRKYKVWIDDKCFSEKPSEVETRRIQAIPKVMKEYTGEQIQEAIEEGKTIVIGQEGTNLVVIDMDYPKFSISHIIGELKRIGLLPILFYYTFSHTDEKPRYRLIFEIDRYIPNLITYKIIYKFLESLPFLEGMDISKSNFKSLFYGSNRRAYYFSEVEPVNIRDVAERTGFNIQLAFEELMKKKEKSKGIAIQQVEDSKIKNLLGHPTIKKILAKEHGYNDSLAIAQAFQLIGFDILPYLNFTLNNEESHSKREADIRRFIEQYPANLPKAYTDGMHIWNIIQQKKKAGAL